MSLTLSWTDALGWPSLTHYMYGNGVTDDCGHVNDPTPLWMWSGLRCGWQRAASAVTLQCGMKIMQMIMYWHGRRRRQPEAAMLLALGMGSLAAWPTGAC